MSDYKIDTLEVENQIIAPAATTSVAGLQSAADKTKLDAVALGATQNSTDAQLRDRSTHTGTQLAATISDFAATVSAQIAALRGAINGLASLDGSGKVPSNQLPAIAISDTFVVASQAAQVALTAETGDIAVRTDLNKSFILRVNDPSVFANWQELLTPTDSVLSVNGQTGTVTLTTTNINEGTNLYFTGARVIASVITGVSFLTNSAILATDTVLQAFGKLQAQITALITTVNGKENTITATTAADYYRGDKTFQPLNKAAVGLANVDNTSDANKPISTATQTALNLKSDTTHTHPNGTQTVPGFISTGDKTKIDGVQAGATANSTDAQLRARSTHTGTQLASTISDFAATVRSTVLTGVSFVDSLIVTTDSILVGIGKLQGQITQAIANSTAALALKANLAGGNTFTGAQRIEGGFTVKEPANTALVLAADGGAGNFVSFEFKPFEGRTGGSSSRIVGLDNNFSSDLIFYNAQTGAGTNVAIERMRLGADGQLSVGTSAPSASAKVQIDSTTQGFLPPRVTTAQRNAIATPAAGLAVYDTSLNQMHYYNGTQWIPWNIFGQGYAFFSDLTAFSTTSGTNVVAATFPYTAPDVGTYRINMQWNFTTNSTTNSARFQTFVDGVAQSSLIEVEVKDATDDLTYNVFTNVALTAGAHTIELRVNMENFSTLTVSIVKCEVWRVL